MFPFITLIAIVGIIFWYSNLSEARYHETLRRLIENGQTLDEKLLSSIPRRDEKRPRNDLRDGTILTGVGFGIFLLGLVTIGDAVMGVGLLVLCIGAATLVYGHFTREKNTSKQD